ncbi:MAG: hypothetical protein GXP54_02800, partial [Deltaproteobacteria bacterium]|nr:hypothetical protein [Deltaproteobacteria bacterium]
MRSIEIASIKVASIFMASFVSCVTGGGLDADPSNDVIYSPLVADSGAIQPVVWQGRPGKGWKEVDRLMDEQKYEKASEIVEGILKSAIDSGDSEEWARSLIRWVQLRTSLHGYETAVRFLKDQEWPDEQPASTVLELFYAQSLVNYARMYSWEINKRERVVSTAEVDLKKWTMRQIHDEARKAYLRVWNNRVSLGTAPVETLKEFISPNDYPDGVRDTLRDAVTYLFVELLANTQGWTPEQSNEVYRLDLGGLLKSGIADRDAQIADAGQHPLVRIAAALDDLEQWHAEKGERDAAFEARLERLRRLNASFTGARDRKAIRADLESRLPGMSDRPWGAMGTALLAEFVRDSGEQDALKSARKIAKRGLDALPASIGGKRCLNIVKSIEAPDYGIEAMRSDGPARRSIGINYKNLGKLYFRAYTVNMKRRINTADDWNLLPDQQEINRLVRQTKPSHEWEVPLERTIDYRMHRAWVTPPMKKPGLYVVAASADYDFSRYNNRLMAVLVVIGDIVLLSRQGDGEVEITARSGSTGRPIKDVTVDLYAYNWHRGHKLAASGRSGKDGTFVFKGLNRGNEYFAYAHKGRQVALDQGYFNFYRRAKPYARYTTLMYTDRSIYRPMQKLMWKAVVYLGRRDRADYRTTPGRRVTVSLMDANGQTVESRTIKTNDFGTASGEFTIPAGRILGQWRVQSSLNGQAWVRVEEYKRPTFEARLLDPEKPLRLNRPASLKGEVKYYFGLPVTEGTVKWRVKRDPVYPWWWGWYGWGGGATGSQTVATGASSLDENGRFKLDFTPLADERTGKDTRGITYRYSVTADVTDEGGETRTASRSFRLGFVAVEASLVMENSFLLSGRPTDLKITRSDLNGTPAPGKGSWRVTMLKQDRTALLPADQPIPAMPGANKGFRTKGDGLRPRWNPNYSPYAVMRGWKDGATVAGGTIEHGLKGDGELALPALKPGAYRLRYRTTDPFGAEYEMSREFVVAGERMKMALPALFMVERSSVKVGETARVLVLSGLNDQPMTLDVYRDSRRIGRTRMVSGDAPTLIEIPITEAQRGGFGLTLTAVRDHQVMTFSGSVFVPWDNKELTVAFSTFRDLLKPGGKEKWTVKVTGPAGRDAAVPAAEVLAYMYDRSLDLFAPHSPPSPLSVFPGRTGVVWPRANLGQAQATWVDSRGFASLPGYPSLQNDQLAFFSNWGIGGPGIRGYVGGGGFGRGILSKKAMPRASAARMAQPAVMGDMAVPEEAEATATASSGMDKGEMKMKGPTRAPADG